MTLHQLLRDSVCSDLGRTTGEKLDNFANEGLSVDQSDCAHDVLINSLQHCSGPVDVKVDSFTIVDETIDDACDAASTSVPFFFVGSNLGEPSDFKMDSFNLEACWYKRCCFRKRPSIFVRALLLYRLRLGRTFDDHVNSFSIAERTIDETGRILETISCPGKSFTKIGQDLTVITMSQI